MTTDVCQPPNASDLPTELKLLILEHLSDDEISPLALVWKDILSEVHARRFRKLTVQPQARLPCRVTTPDSDYGGHTSDHSFVAKFGSAKRNLQPSHRRSDKRVPMSARELEAESRCECLRRLIDVLNEAPELSDYIQSLTIRDTLPDTETLQSALSRSPSLPAFVAIIPQMPNLSHLCLHDLDFYLFHDPQVIHRALRQCHITSLEVKSCTLKMSIFLAILYAVVNLDVLRLEDLHLNPGFGDDYNEHSEHITDFDNVATQKSSKSAFLCVDELHMTLHTRDDWLFFDLLLSKNSSPLYDLRAFHMIYQPEYDHSQILVALYTERISRFIKRNDLEELHLAVWDSDDGLLPLHHIGGVHTLELCLPLSDEWEPHLTPLSWCTHTLANIAQTSCLLRYLTLTFGFHTRPWQYVQMPSTRWPQWEDLDRVLLDLDLEELVLVFPLRFVTRDDLYPVVSVVDDSNSQVMQMKSKIQTWFFRMCLPESGKKYFGRDDPSENVGIFSYELSSTMAKYSSIRLERS